MSGALERTRAGAYAPALVFYCHDNLNLNFSFIWKADVNRHRPFLNLQI